MFLSCFSMTFEIVVMLFDNESPIFLGERMHALIMRGTQAPEVLGMSIWRVIGCNIWWFLWENSPPDFHYFLFGPSSSGVWWVPGKKNETISWELFLDHHPWTGNHYQQLPSCKLISLWKSTIFALLFLFLNCVESLLSSPVLGFLSYLEPPFLLGKLTKFKWPWLQ